MSKFFSKRLLMVSGQPVLSKIRVVPVFGEVDFVTVDLNSPVTMTVSGKQEINDVIVFILRQVAPKIGIRAFREKKVDFVFNSHEDRLKSFNTQVERHTVLVQLVDTPAEEGESPAKKLVLVRIDLKYPRFTHVRRLLRKIRVRWIMITR